MKLAVSALMVLSLILVIGCDSNDKNTVDPIPKYHSVYPVFHLKFDNGYQMFGIDSMHLTTVPDIGWLGPVYTDKDGFIGTLAAGTFITDIDTTYRGDTMIVDTISQVFGFQPSQTYKFSFTRTEPFLWHDIFKAEYITSIDSVWGTFSAETLEVTIVPDSNRAPDTVLDRVAVILNPLDTILDPPDSVAIQELLYGIWLDTAWVINDPADTIAFPPESTYKDTVVWGFWNRIDSFFLPPDPAYWCDLDSIEIVRESIPGGPGLPAVWVLDSIYHYSNCSAYIDSTQERVFPYRGWGWYPGGDTTSDVIVPSFDQTTHFIFPDTLKGLIFGGQGASVYTWMINGNDTTSDTTPATIYFYDNGTPREIDSLAMQLTMPPVEVFPDYRIIIRQESKKK
jgi:hypothetical protein